MSLSPEGLTLHVVDVDRKPSCPPPGRRLVDRVAIAPFRRVRSGAAMAEGCD